MAVIDIFSKRFLIGVFAFLLLLGSAHAELVNAIGVQIGMESSETGNEKSGDTNLLQVSNDIGYGLSWELSFGTTTPVYQSIYTEFNYFENPYWQRIHYEPEESTPQSDTSLSVYQQSSGSVMTFACFYRVGLMLETQHMSWVGSDYSGYYDSVSGVAFWILNIYGGPVFTYLTTPGIENVGGYTSGRFGGEVGYRLGPGTVYFSLFAQYNRIEANELAEGWSSGFYMRASLGF